MAKNSEKSRLTATGGYVDKPWIPRIWDGMTLRAWMKLLVRNRFAVNPIRWPMVGFVTFGASVSATFGTAQTLIYGRRIARTQIVDDPIFIIGHWRSGTTLLHELLTLDQRHTFPNYYDCFAPTHFLTSGWLLRPTVGLLMPKTRPQDNVQAGWDRPQEEEFALCNMGARSPYLTAAFPNRPPQDQEYLDLEQLTPEAREQWKQHLLWFLKCLTLREPKRIVLKSPAHTCRVKYLLEMFPKARFVHIVRDPYVLFPSTMNLWKRLYRDEGFQLPRYAGLEEHVFRTLTRMYEVFERDRPLIPQGQFCEVRYEDLVPDLLGQTRRIYEELDLGEFDRALPALKDFVAKQADYKTNRYEMDPELREEIARRWAPYVQRYGYAAGGLAGASIAAPNGQ